MRRLLLLGRPLKKMAGHVAYIVSLLAMLCSPPQVSAFAPIDQTGNLIQNGNFESGSFLPWVQNDNPTVSIATNQVIDGDFAVFIDTTTGHPGNNGNWMVGLWQYPDLLPEDTYTVSAWFRSIAGQAHLGLSGSHGVVAEFSSPTSVLNEWQFLEFTYHIQPTGGPLLYGLINQAQSYVDGVWLNRGSDNLSPYAPQNGFPNPNAIVPEPATLLLLGVGLSGLIAFRIKRPSGTV